MLPFLLKKAGSLFLFWCFAVLLTAQAGLENHGRISGIVTDAESGETLSFVNIRFTDTLQGTSTNYEGRFEISNVLPGSYTLTASYVGYKQQVIENIMVTPGSTTELSINLEPAAFITEEVVITAAAKPQAAKLAPASIALVTAKQIREKNITTFDQAFDEVPGVIVTRSTGANVQAFSIRGASEVAGGGTGNRVLLLVDGRPALSPESGGALWNLVPINSIERIEVVKGAYSSLYGSSAMGGVVNVITRKPAPEPQTRIHLNYGFYNKAPASTNYSKYNDFHALEFSHSRTHKRLSYLVDGGWKSNDGHREKSGFDQYNFYNKLFYGLKNNRNIQLALNANRIKNDSPATWFSKTQAYSVAPHRKDDYQDRREYNADMYYYALPNSRVKYSTRLFYYHSFFKYSFDDDPENDSTNVNIGKQEIDVETIRTQRVGSLSQLDLFVNADNYLIAGLDVKWDKIVGLPDNVLYGRHQAFSLGTYVQDEITFSPRLTATVGVRFDHYQIIDEFQESNISPKAALVYKANENLSFRTLVAQAFRNPSMSERFIKFEQGGGLQFLPNPDLKAEKLKLSLEVGTKMKFTKTSSLDIALFYNRYNDLISFRQLSKPLEPLLYQVVNLKKAVMQGVEVTYQRRFGDFLTLRIGYTFLDAKDVSEERINDELAYKVRHSFSISSSANYKNISLNINGRYRSRIEEVFIYPGSEPDAAFILNGKLSYKAADKHSVYFAIDNLTDKQYEELERYRMPGRSYTMGAVLNF